MQKYLLLALIIVSIPTFAQPLSRCGTVPTASANQPGGAVFEQWIRQNMPAARSQSDTSLMLIPVVFHIIHNGEPIGQGANLPESQIRSQIQILNQDFGKMVGSSGHNLDPAGTDTRIRFVLASQSRSGAPLNPISRTNGGRAAWFQDQLDTLKNLINQNPDFYLNIWTANLAGGSLGYSSWPESGLSGLSNNAQNPNHDGLVIHYMSCGANPAWVSPYNLGRTATHEIGHYLGLLHVWGQLSQDCNDTDYCADTPTSAGPNLGCPTTANSCPNLPGLDMVRNYLNYTFDACMNVFTNDQAARMRSVLVSSPRRATLLGWHITGTKVEDANSLQNIQIWPTHSQDGVFYISGLPDNAALELVDMLGKQVNVTLGKSQIKVSKSGFYILKVGANNRFRNFKIIRQ